MEKYKLNGRPVEVEEIDSNRDGSKFITKAGYTDGAQEDLTDAELNQLQQDYDDCDALNGMWG